MINIGHTNKKFLFDLLRKKLEEQIKNMENSLYSYNFTKENPYFELTIQVHTDSFEVVVLRDQVEILRKQLERAKEKNTIKELKGLLNNEEPRESEEYQIYDDFYPS